MSVDQVRRADREIFIRMADLTRSGFIGLGDPTEDILPLDNILSEVLEEHRIVALLLPLPGSAGSTRGQTGEKRQGGEVEKLREEVKRLRSEAKGSGKDRSAAKTGKGGKPGKKKNPKVRFQSMPKELIGQNSVINGQPLCFDYNMKKGCSERGVERCKKGLHLCSFPGCGGKHSSADCDSPQRHR